jgi:hypothetical protein
MFDLFTISDEQRVCVIIAVMVLTVLAVLVGTDWSGGKADIV